MIIKQNIYIDKKSLTKACKIYTKLAHLTKNE